MKFNALAVTAWIVLGASPFSSFTFPSANAADGASRGSEETVGDVEAAAAESSDLSSSESPDAPENRASRDLRNSEEGSAKLAEKATTKGTGNETVKEYAGTIVKSESEATSGSSKSTYFPFPGQDLGQRLFNPELIDTAELRSNALELLINDKVRRLVKAHVGFDDQYRANSTITITAIQPRPADAIDPTRKDNSPALSKGGDTNALGLTFEGESLFSLNNLVDRYKKEARSESRLSRSLASDISDTIAQTSKTTNDILPIRRDDESEKVTYEVSGASIQVTVSDQLGPEVVKAIDKSLKDAFTPAFGSRLALQVRSGNLLPTPPPEAPKAEPVPQPDLYTRLIELARRFQILILGVVAIIAFFTALILGKFYSWLTSRGESRQAGTLSFQQSDGPQVHTLTAAEVQANVEEAAKNAAEAQAALVARETEIAEMHARDAAKTLEDQIITFVKTDVKAPKYLIQDWMTSEEHYPKLMMMLEMLARRDIPFEKPDVRMDVIRTIRERRRDIAAMSAVQVKNELEDLYWALVSTSYLGHNTAGQSFAVLDSVDDISLYRIMSKQTPEVQAAILMSLPEKRAARMMGKFSAGKRNEILRCVSSGKVLDDDAIKDTVIQLLNEIESSANSPLKTAAADDGIEAILPLLTKMRFETQFTTAQSFMGLEKAMRTRILNQYFNVALLPIARDEFLGSLFMDKDTEWVRAIISPFDAELKQRVLMQLPPMQQRMLEGGTIIPRGIAMNALKELNQSICQKLEQGELSHQEIFDLDESSGQNQQDENTSPNVHHISAA
ncbi:MAG: hypothetical protein H7222_15910 [Methylotenera sp.]|nr:hypothetical protein [Oligoflexia bacterium]